MIPLTVKSLKEAINKVGGPKLSFSKHDSAELIACLSKLTVETTDYGTLVANGFDYYKHIHRGYLIGVKDDFAWDWLEKCSELDLTLYQIPEAYLIVASGTLDKWQNVFIKCLTQKEHPEFRQSLEGVFKSLVNEGFEPIFNRYRQRKDTAIYLEAK